MGSDVEQVMKISHYKVLSMSQKNCWSDLPDFKIYVIFVPLVSHETAFNVGFSHKINYCENGLEVHEKENSSSDLVVANDSNNVTVKGHKKSGSNFQNVKKLELWNIEEAQFIVHGKQPLIIDGFDNRGEKKMKIAKKS